MVAVEVWDAWPPPIQVPSLQADVVVLAAQVTEAVPWECTVYVCADPPLDTAEPVYDTALLDLGVVVIAGLLIMDCLLGWLLRR